MKIELADSVEEGIKLAHLAREAAIKNGFGNAIGEFVGAVGSIHAARITSGGSVPAKDIIQKYLAEMAGNIKHLKATELQREYVKAAMRTLIDLTEVPQ